METRDAKSQILKAGARIVLEKGFCDTGLAEVLEGAKVPKGSFYFQVPHLFERLATPSVSP